MILADGRVVAWHLSSGDLVRQDGADRQRWAGLPDATVAVDGAAVRVTIAGVGPVVLPRAVELLNGGTR